MTNLQKIEDVLIVTIEGDNKLNASTAQQFKAEVLELINEPGLKIVISLGGVSYIDSSGFGALLSVLRSSRNNKSHLKLCNVSDQVMELVKLLQLQTVFDIRESVDDCIKAF